MTRILHIIPTLDRGGAEKQLTLLASGMKRRGADVHVCCLTRGGPLASELTAAGVPLKVIGKRWKLDPFAYFALKRQIAELQPDIVHTWLFAANCYGRQAAFDCGVKHVLANERCVDLWKTWWHFAIDRYLARKTEKLVTNSAGVVEFYAQNGIAAEKFRVISNGIHLPNAATLTLERNTLLHELDLPAGARLIATVGRLWPQKRLKDLIWAFDLLQCVVDDVYLLIIGEGPQRWRLERYARQVLTPESRVLFLGERSDVPQLLPHLECFWLGSEYEGQSNAVMEAMSTGLPVVATNIPGNRDLIVSGESGYLVPVGDRAGFAACTREILADNALAQRLGRTAREQIERAFSIEKMVQAYESLYAEVMGT